MISRILAFDNDYELKEILRDIEFHIQRPPMEAIEFVLESWKQSGFSRGENDTWFPRAWSMFGEVPELINRVLNSGQDTNTLRSLPKIEFKNRDDVLLKRVDSHISAVITSLSLVADQATFDDKNKHLKKDPRFQRVKSFEHELTSLRNKIRQLWRDIESSWSH